MSWDVFIQHMPASALRFADIADDYIPLPLGSHDEVVAAIGAVFPATDASDPTWLTVEDPRYSIEFGIGSDDPVTTLALHVRGDDSVIAPIAQLTDRLGARAIDSWTGEFFDPPAAVESIQRWRAYVEEG